MADCTHERTLRLSAKCSDMCHVYWPNDQDTDGYAPSIDGLGGGDYVEFSVCIDCKVVLGLADADAILATQDEAMAEEKRRQEEWERRKAEREARGGRW
jgi:hypothetical protein